MAPLAIAAATILSACGGGSEPSAGAGTGIAAGGAASAQGKRALAAPGAFTANGWYWNPQEGGTGFMIEAQGSRAFVGFFMYEEGTGNPVWYVAYGFLTPGDASTDFTFNGSLQSFAGGRPVTVPMDTAPAVTPTTVGEVVISFSGGRAQAVLPGGRVMPAERFPINGTNVGAGVQRPQQPEVGWYWNPAEGGRGYAIEVQDDKVFMAIFHYNLDGSPTWNLFQGDITTGIAVDQLQMTSGGQSLTSAHRSGVRDLLGPFTMSFRNPCAGQMQLYGAPPILLRRFVIDGSPLAAGEECGALATLSDLPDVATSFAELSPGDSVYGRIDRAGDADGFRVPLIGGVTYTFDLRGVTSGVGTLADPILELYGPDLTLQTQNDDRFEGGSRFPESRIEFTPNQSGVYRLRATGSGGSVGTYLLSVGGLAPNLSPYATAPVSSYEGPVAGNLRGSRPGTLAFDIQADGTVSGTLRYVDAPDVSVALA
ncbi:MAG: hypothetical protein JNM26_16495, partial [Ideonella sp.]|nr:hypothetical protein [Ideonella sp.]